MRALDVVNAQTCAKSRATALDFVSVQSETKMHPFGAWIFPIKKRGILTKKVYVREVVELYSAMQKKVGLPFSISEFFHIESTHFARNGSGLSL